MAPEPAPGPLLRVLTNASYACVYRYLATVAGMADRQTDMAPRRHVPQRSGEELLFNRSLGRNLRTRRDELGLTQDELAARAGMTRGSIANIERGDQVPGLFRLLVICSSLDVDLRDLLPQGHFSASAIAETIDPKYSIAVREIQRRAREGQSSRGVSQ